MSVILDPNGSAVGAITVEDGQWIGRDTSGRLLFTVDSETAASRATRGIGQPTTTVRFGLLPVRSGEQRSDRVATDRRGLPYITRPWLMYVTPCCHATVTIGTDDGVLCCRACYGDVDPRLAWNPDPS
jgi:hypothetical protein